MAQQTTLTHSVYIITPNGEWEIKPDQIKPLGKGGTARVYSLNNNDNLLLKIYHANILDKYAQHYADKLQAMLAKPPKNTQITIQGKEQKYHQFAWPLHLVKNKNQQIIGYAMYRLKKDEFFSLQEYLYQNIANKKERETIIDKSLDIRIQVALNLALCMRNLHKVGHLFVDMKQENIFIHKQDRTVCFIDCDGFSIEQGKYPALHYSNNYKAPFVLKQNLKPAQIKDIEQDYYCLAHLIFEILNYGITPFKGVPSEKIQEEILNSGSENTNDYKVKNQLYPYAVNRQFKGIYPDEMSIHQYWPEDIQVLFDRAFNQNKTDIPNATEWAKCLRQHIKNANFEKCNQYPDNELHHHFKGTNCFACEVFNDSSKNKPTKNTPDIDEYLTQNAVSDLLSSSSSSSSINEWGRKNLAFNKLSDAEVQSAIKTFEYGGYAEALSVFRKAANQGNKDAQYYLGEMYYHGKGVSYNPKEAFKWYEKAANQEHAEAQSQLGRMYQESIGTERNTYIASFWFNKAKKCKKKTIKNLPTRY